MRYYILSEAARAAPDKRPVYRPNYEYRVRGAVPGTDLIIYLIVSSNAAYDEQDNPDRNRTDPIRQDNSFRNGV